MSSTTILNGNVEITSSVHTYTVDISNTGDANADFVVKAGGNPVLTASATGVSLVQAPLSIPSGGTGLIALPGPAPTSSYIASDANGKVQLVNEINQVTTLSYNGTQIAVTINGVAQSAVSGSVYQMTEAATGDFKILGGSQTFTIKLPSTNTMPYYNERYNIFNNSSNTVHVNTTGSSSNLVKDVQAGALGLFLNTVTNGTAGNVSDWTVVYTSNTSGQGTVTSVSATSGTGTFLTLSQTGTSTIAPIIDLEYGGAALPLANGGTGQTSLITSPTPSAIVAQDANANYSANNVLVELTQVPNGGSAYQMSLLNTGGEVEVIDSGSPGTQTIYLPDLSGAYQTNALAPSAGTTWNFLNSGTHPVTISTYNGGATVYQLIYQGDAVTLELTSLPTTPSPGPATSGTPVTTSTAYAVPLGQFKTVSNAASSPTFTLPTGVTTNDVYTFYNPTAFTLVVHNHNGSTTGLGAGIASGGFRSYTANDTTGNNWTAGTANVLSAFNASAGNYSTINFYPSTVSNTGSVLTSNGAGQNPSFQALGSLGVITSVSADGLNVSASTNPTTKAVTITSNVIGVAQGGTNQTTNVVAPVANGIPSWDSSLALTVKNVDFVPKYLNTAGVTGTHVVTNLTPADGRIVLSNAAFQDIVLPDATQTLPNGNNMLGYQVEIYNSGNANSTTVSVYGSPQTAAGVTVSATTYGYYALSTTASTATADPTQPGFIPGNTSFPIGAKAKFTCIDNTQNAIGSWIWEWIPINDYTNNNRLTDVRAGFTNNGVLQADYFGNVGMNNTRYQDQSFSSSSYQWGGSGGGAIFSSNGGAAGSVLTPTSGYFSIDLTIPKYITLTPSAGFQNVVLPFCVGNNTPSSAQGNQCVQGLEWNITNNSNSLPLYVYLFEYAGSTPSVYPVTNTALTSGQTTSQIVPIVPTTVFVTIPPAAPLISGTSGTPGRYYSATFRAIAQSTSAHYSPAWQVTPNWDMNMTRFGSIWTTTATSSTTYSMTAQYTPEQEFTTGTANQTITLPNSTTCQLGQYWKFFNKSTYYLTIQNTTPTTQITVPPGAIATVTCETNASSAGTWLTELNNPLALGTTGNISLDVYKTASGTTTWIGAHLLYYSTRAASISASGVTQMVTCNGYGGVNVYDASGTGSVVYNVALPIQAASIAQAFSATCYQGSGQGSGGSSPAFTPQTVPCYIASGATVATMQLNFIPTNATAGVPNDEWVFNFTYHGINL